MDRLKDYNLREKINMIAGPVVAPLLAAQYFYFAGGAPTENREAIVKGLVSVVAAVPPTLMGLLPLGIALGIMSGKYLKSVRDHKDTLEYNGITEEFNL